MSFEIGQVVFREKPHAKNGEVYEAAYIGEELVRNKSGVYLTRLMDRQGEGKYYLTMEREVSMCLGCGDTNCSSEWCRGAYRHTTEYKSKYVGNELLTAVNTLLSGEFNLEWREDVRQQIDNRNNSVPSAMDW